MSFGACGFDSHSGYKAGQVILVRLFFINLILHEVLNLKKSKYEKVFIVNIFNILCISFKIIRPLTYTIVCIA